MPASYGLRLLRPALLGPNSAQDGRALRRLDLGEDLSEHLVVVNRTELRHQLQTLSAELQVQGDLDALEQPPSQGGPFESIDERHALLLLECAEFFAELFIQRRR